MSARVTNSWLLVAGKECRELLVSGRFLIAAVVVFGLVAGTIAALTRNYARELADYGREAATRQESLREYGHLNRVSAWIDNDRPNPMSAMVKGLEQHANLESFDNDPLAVAYPLPDLTVVVGVLLSLLALLFAHEALSGEREDGTLRLLVAHHIPRVGVVMGKIAGRSLALLVPLMLGLVAGSLVIALSPDLGWGAREWGAALAVGLASALYVGAFVALGVMISSWTRTARSSLVVSLGVWAMLILIVPNLSPYVAAMLRPTPSVTQLQRRTREMADTERDELVRQLSREYREPLIGRHPELNAYFGLSAEGQDAALAADPRLRAAVDTFAALGDSAVREANRVQREAIEALEADFEVRQRAQIRATRWVSSLSPYPAFVYAAMTLSETGVRAAERREDQLSAWGETAFRPWYVAMADSLRSDDPRVDWANTHVDLSGMPRFDYEPEPLESRLGASASQMSLLVLFSVIFLALAAVGFNRYDVR